MDKRNIHIPAFVSILIAGSLTNCYKDQGNYDYSEIEKIEIYFGTDEEGEKITTFQVSAMRNSEYIEVNPTIVSSTYGEIKEGDPNYEFGCKISYSPKDGARWTDIDTLKTKDVKYFANMPAGDYQVWYTVTNKETGIVTSAVGKAKVIISTYEGWMVLSNNGADSRARLDMIFTNSKGEEVVASDVMGESSPAIYNARSLYMNTSRKSTDDQIFLLAESGGYQLNNTYLSTRESDNIKVYNFMSQNEPGEVICWNGIYNGYAGGNQSEVCITTEGNAYAVHFFGANAGFEYPMNAETVGGKPTYRVAPFVGHAMERSGASNCALFYDIDNKRFMGFDYSLEGSEARLLFPLRVQGTQYFPFETGMDLITMKSTKFINGLVYSVLQDSGKKRHVYGIDMSGDKSSSCFRQECAYSGITATDFNTATDYAFHSQFPLMFYCKRNKVYSFNLATRKLCDTLRLDGGETVTMIKFNLFQGQYQWFVDQSPEFFSKQFDLIVASTTGEENGGIVRFYSIDADGKLILKSEFTGLGEEVVDVTYRERKK